MDLLISLGPPKTDLAVQVIQILEGVDPEEIPQVPQRPFNSSFLIGPVRVAQMNGKTEMASEVQKLGIELQLWTSFDHHRLDVVIPMSMGHTSYLSISLDVALQKELQALAGIKPHIEVSGVGQNHSESVSHSPRQTLLDPIDLSLFSGQKRQFMISLPPLLAIPPSPDRDRDVTPLKSITFEPFIDLRSL
jgi:hypothetical protein